MSLNWDLDTEKKEFELIPNGAYKAIISDCSIHDTKAGNGEYIKCEFTIMEGDHKGRKIWNNINAVNQNPKAVEIAMGQLKDILFALGKDKFPPDLEGVCEAIYQGIMLINVKSRFSNFKGSDENYISFVTNLKGESRPHTVKPKIENVAPKMIDESDSIPF